MLKDAIFNGLNSDLKDNLICLIRGDNMSRIRKIAKGLMLIVLILTLVSPLGAGVAKANTPENLPDNAGSATLTDTAPTSVNVTKDTYQFTSSGQLMKKSTGEVNDKLLNNILKEKQGALLTDVQRSITSNLNNTTISGGIYTDSTSLWSSGYNMSDWYENTSSTIIYMESGGTAYKIEVPAGNKGTTNQDIIGATIGAVSDYMLMVKESTYVGLMAASYNVYSMIPSKQIPVANILEPERSETGQLTGRHKIKSSGTGVKITYSLKNYYHPISGKAESVDIGETKAKIDKYIVEQYKKMTFDTGASKDKILFVVNSDFSAFYSDMTSNAGMYTKVESSSVVTANGVKSHTTKRNKKEVMAQSRIDGTFPLALPSLFVSSDTNYQLSEKSGYVLDDSTSLLLSNAMVYKNSEGGKDSLGDFSSFGIDLNGIAMVSLKVDKDGKPTNADKDFTHIGVIVPLWFKEAVANTATESGELISDDIYFTGRIVKLNNDYNTKTRLDGTNKDLVATDTKITGRVGIEMRRYAFLPDGDYKNRESHVTVGNKPEQFKIQTHFEKDPQADYRGFAIYRNNSYLSDDSQLINWLKTEEAKAMTDVKAEDLVKLVTGEIGLEPEDIKYEDWVRMQEIKNELDVSVRDRVTSAMNIVSIILGYMIIIYSILLCVAYWFDIVNVFVEFSLLKLITGGRLYAIPNKDALEYVSSTSSGENLKYVTFWHVFLIMMIGIFVGLIFIFVSPIIKFILWLYFLISDVMGVS